MGDKQLAVIYTRVSTEEQKNGGNSLQAQEDELIKYAEQKGLKVVRVYCDGGYSGKDFNRPEFQQMMKDLEKGEFQVILAWRVDRISRNNKDVLTLIENELRPRNCKLLISIGDIDSSTDNGFMMISLLGTLAQHERASIISRVKLGMNKRASEGKWNGGLIYGYDCVDKKLVINEAESEVIRNIFQMRLEAMGYKAIAHRLNERGITTKTGKLFSIFSIKTILTNPTYIGQNRWSYHQDWNTRRRKGKNEEPIIVEGQHEAVINIELWEKVQAVQLASKNSVSTNKNFNGEFLLSGLLRCPKCGSGTVMSKSKKYDGSGYHLYYMCQAYHSKGKVACDTNLIPKERIEEQVILTVKALLHSDSIIDEVLEKLEHDVKQDTIEIKQTLNFAEKELSQNEALQKKLDADYFAGSIAVQQYNRLSEHLRVRIEELNNRVDEFQRMLDAEYAKIQIDRDTVNKALINFNSLFDSATNEQKKALIRALVKRIDVEPDRKRIKDITFWFFDKPTLPLSKVRRTVS
ncbi:MULTISPECIES: recombinase family protein [Paenibacillus]|uniref:Recombinase family protein n=1 Tax=Paenibacillus validus TaxID=44253 RepID=A0A7X3CSH4_9BACL|nr:recombinase family protein [Paenibacillus validus]MUG71785.1 recombinase family protein [Paenibacillus validus]